MKRLFVLFLFASLTSFAQPGQWTWMQGSSIPNSAGNYGTQNVWSATNEPHGFYEVCEWTDKQGNFWMFSGNAGWPNFYSDMWEFKASLNQWCWIKGPGLASQPGNYGTINIPSPTNNPGGRGFGVPTWVDTAGNLWLFGGLGYDVNSNSGHMSDLWKFDIITHNWTWMKGPNTNGDPGTYGTINVPNIANNPPSREETNASWTDGNNNLWLFGGGYSAPGHMYNDLWKYNIATNMWTWMSGSNTINAPSVYGVKGVPNNANVPGARTIYSKWKDSNGNFWLFGGNTNTNACYNDLWRYNPTTNQWTWMSGTNLTHNAGLHGARCVSDTSFVPCGRFENRACWNGGCDNFLLFGGIDEFTYPTNYVFNDLWSYNVTSNQWTWVSGTLDSNNVGHYGTITVSSSLNIPPNRCGAIGWKDNNGYLWMFGGGGTLGGMNDMWRYIPDSTCPASGGTTTSAFTANPISGCSPLTVNFTNTSINGSSFLWNFGDNTTSTSTNPTHLFTDSGTYIVKLIAYPSCGGAPDTITHIITVSLRAHASFAADTLIGCNILTVHFTNNSTGAISYHWYFGDGNESFNTNPTHSYSAGSYTIILIAHGANGCDDDTTIAHYITVIASPTVIPSFTSNPGTGCFPLTVHFTNTSNVGTSFYWDFGDGHTDTAQNPVHIFDTVGYFLVYLTVYDSTICGIQSAQYTKWDTVNVSPVNGFTAAPMTGCTPDTVIFTNTTTGATSYLWNFGDLSPTSTAGNPTHIYTSAGHDTVTLISYGLGGCNDTTHLVITINQTQTVSSTFTANPLSGCVPVTVNFTNTSINATTTLWNFGDTFTSTSTNPSHTYTNPGTYIVKLYSSNASVCGTVEDSSNVTIVVNPWAHDTFTVSPASGCTPLTVTFTNLSTNASSYHWDFGDASLPSNAVSPSHTYTAAGTDTVTMIAYGAGGCNDTMKYFPITVLGAPTTTSAFTPSNNLQACDSLTVQFTNGSTNAMAYHWNFGDGNISTLASPSHTYTTSGTFTVTLIAYDTTACGVASDTSKHINQIIINPSAHAAFPDSSFVGCNNITILFGNTSTNATGYLWSFGDGNTSTSGNPTYTYSDTGVYKITLIAYGVGGCNDTLINQDTVTIINTHISSAFVADSVTGCSPFTVHFTNQSQNGLTYLWSFGDGGTSTATNPSHTYQDSGTFTVKLYTYRNTLSPCGILIDSSVLISNISVDTPIHPQSIFTTEPKSGCSPILVSFVDSSKNYNFSYWNFGDGSFDSLATYLNPSRIYFAGNYTATLITYYLNKCNTSPDTMKVNIVVDTCNLLISNVFTPNGDGKNDLFKFEADGFTNYHLEIFDRWGLKVFESSDTKLQWNGKINNTGGDAPDGTYYYIFTSIDFNQKDFQTHGYLTLIR